MSKTLQRQTAASPDTVARSHSMQFGTELHSGGDVSFRLWAPGCHRIELAIEGRSQTLPLRQTADGWHELRTDAAVPGTLYRFVLPDGTRVSDPASRFQPDDVHGPSEVVDPAFYRWRDAAWAGRPWHETVLYELHIGSFTPEGTFRAAIERLDHLEALGVTAIEIMPIADFPGQWNWGYDGVLLYAPDSSYGRPDELKTLVDAAHARGISVLLDVVYNHFGPDGNLLSAYVPQFYTARHKTPWGDAINYDGEGSDFIREFVIHNALYWIEEFHLDGLRLDAVHAIVDQSAEHLLAELAARVRASTDRPVHLLLENEENDPSRLARTPQSAPQREPHHYTAQWNDDVHHVLHVAATGEGAGYYADYRGDTDKLGRAIAEGFAFQGEMMPYRGETRGEPSAHLPPDAFVAFIQNHDQIGNRAFGDRIGVSTPAAALRAIAAIYLLLPQVPMLFMGEEWAASQPFPFFCDFDGDLAEAVTRGRRAEFARFPEFQDEATRARIPDPQAAATFRSAKLDWFEPGTTPHAEWLAWYKRVLATRRTEITPLIPRIAGNAARYEVLGAGAVAVHWRINDGRILSLEANLSDAPVPHPPTPGHVLWQQGDAADSQTLGSWMVRWSQTAHG